MGKAYDVPQTNGQQVPATMPAAGAPITEFVDGVPVDPATGRPMQKVVAAPPGQTGPQPAWTEHLKMPTVMQSPVPPAALAVEPPPVDALPQVVQRAPDGSVTQIKVPGLPVMGVETGPLPAVPAAPPVATGKCITEGCKNKTKDRGMCAKCLKDTITYMAKDQSVTWEFLEANGLALPTSSASSGNKFLAGLTAKLKALHSIPTPPSGKVTESNIGQENAAPMRI